MQPRVGAATTVQRNEGTPKATNGYTQRDGGIPGEKEQELARTRLVCVDPVRYFYWGNT